MGDIGFAAIRSRLSVTVLGTVAAAACLPAAALAAPGPTQIADGLHVSTGAIVDPDGRVWVSDHNGGFCRITQPADTDTALGHIDHPLVAGAPATEPRTCVGGLLPEAAPGPDAAGAPAFLDPTPGFPDSGDEVVLVPDGFAASSAVYRLRWEPETGLFSWNENDPRDLIVMDADPLEPERPRPVAVAVAPDGDAYVTFQRSSSIQRITDPAADAWSVQMIARTSDDRGAAAVAALPGALGPFGPPAILVAETTGIRETTGTPTNPDAPRLTSGSRFVLPSAPPDPLAPGEPPVPITVGAMTFRATDTLAGSGVLYVGSADAVALGDTFDTLSAFTVPGPGTSSLQAVELGSGFTAIGGVAAAPAPGDNVYVLDDPAIVTPGQPIGLGRLFVIGDPDARITSGPSDATNAPGDIAALGIDITSDTTPTFTFTADGTTECSLTATGAPSAWGPCSGAGGDTAAAPLADGAYRFAVRVNDALLGTGAAEKRFFRVDTTAPGAPVIDSPSATIPSRRTPWYEFNAPGEPAPYAFQCRLDADPAGFTSCAQGRIAGPALTNGVHTLQVRTVDAAGNVGLGAVATRTFTVVLNPAGDANDASGAALVAPASAARVADGLHISTGAFQDPVGRTWVSDHNAGLCRVSAPTVEGAGAIEHPQLPADAGPRTCLGGLLPHAGVGPDAAGAPAYMDPTPARRGNGDEFVLVPDGAAASSDLVRALWNPATQRFDFDKLLTGPGDRIRPTAAALGPDDAIYYVTKRESWIVRIVNPQAVTPLHQIVGVTSDGRGAEAIAVGGTAAAPRVYVGEATGISVLTPAATDQGTGATGPAAVLQNVPELAGAGPSALAFDRGGTPRPARLYAGTANALTPADTGTDRVLRLTPVGLNVDPASPTGIGEFTMVGGLGVRRDGTVLVVDDRALVTPGQPLGLGTMSLIGLPAGHVTSGPTSPAGVTPIDPSHSADDTPTFGLGGDAPLECALRPVQAPAAAVTFAPCTATFTPDAPLADGEYKLTVRSATGVAAANIPETTRFTVDTAAPGQATIDAPTEGASTGAAPFFGFGGAGEAHPHYRCVLNGAAAVPCRPGRTFPLVAGASQLIDGTNTLKVFLVDGAGNIGLESAQRSWTADATIPLVTFGPASSGGRQAATSADFRFSANEATSEWQCRLDGAPFRSCAPGAPTGGPGEPTSITTDAGEIVVTYTGLSEATHRLRVSTRDAAGNVSPTATRAVTVDHTGPSALLSTPADSGLTGPTFVLDLGISAATVGDGEPAPTLACTLDGVALAAASCADGATIPAGSPLGQGSHTFTVTATDDLGNVGPAAASTWTVDATGPQLTFGAGVPAEGGTAPSSPSFTWTANESSSFSCQFDGGRVFGCLPGVRDGSLGPGPHTFRLTATDSFGNTTEIVLSFTIVPQNGGGGGGGGGGGAAVPPAPAPVAPPAPLAAPAPVAALAPVVVGRAAAARPIAVTATVPEGATVVQIRLLDNGPIPPAGGAARRRGDLVATVVRRVTRPGQYEFRLTERKLRKLPRRRYILEMRVGPSLDQLGPASIRRFRIAP